MAHIILPERHKRQPLHSVEVDWSNSLSTGMLGAWVPTEPMVELVHRVPLSPYVNRPAPSVSNGHYALYSDGSSSVGVFPNKGTRNIYEPQAGNLSLVSFCALSSEMNAQFSLVRPNGSGTDYAWGVGLHGGSSDGATARFSTTGNPTGTAIQPSQSNELIVTRPQLVTLSIDETTAWLWGSNKTVKSAARTAGDFYYEWTGGEPRAPIFGACVSPTMRAFASYLFSRALSYDEHLALFDAPFQLLRRRIKRTYFFPPQRPEKAPAIIVPDRWRKSRPVTRPRLNEQHPLAASLDFLHVGTEQCNLVSGQPFRTFANPTSNVRGGTGLAYPSSSTTNYSVTESFPHRPLRTYLFLVRRENFNGFNRFCCRGGANLEEHYWDTAGKIEIDRYTNGGATLSWWLVDGTEWPWASSFGMIGITLDYSEAAPKGYVDGRAATITTGQAKIGEFSTAASAPFYIGNRVARDRPWRGDIFFTAIAKDIWGAAEFSDLWQNPWQLLRSDPGRAYFYPKPMQPRRVWTLAPGPKMSVSK